jgi:mono/diheme cytochrome c family protein
MHVRFGVAFLVAAVAGLLGPVAASQQASEPSNAVTFTKVIAPILQRSCQSCHRPQGVAPMPLTTYDEVRPYARAIKQRTGLRDRPGVMPPWFIDKTIGIQHFKEDISLSEEEIGAIARWADNGALRGNPKDMPPPRVFADNAVWQIGTPDLIVSSSAVEMKAITSDWYGVLSEVPTGLTEDRYVAALEWKEVNDVDNKPGRSTVGGLFVFHHIAMNVIGPDGQPSDRAGWPTHEVGRNGDVFDPGAGRLLKAGSRISFPTVHLHANGKDTRAHMQIGFRFHPAGYKPTLRSATVIAFGSGDLDLPGLTSGITQSAYHTLAQPMKLTVFEPHLHAAGVRMCLEAIYPSRYVETLNCAGYDHNWVKTYAYADDAAPLLPRGTILRAIAYFDNTPANRNVVDPRNWSGLGRRSMDNMLIAINQGIQLTDEEFAREVAERRTRLGLREGQTVPGCPMCGFVRIPPQRSATTGGQ